MGLHVMPADRRYGLIGKMTFVMAPRFLRRPNAVIKIINLGATNRVDMLPGSKIFVFVMA